MPISTIDHHHHHHHSRFKNPKNTHSNTNGTSSESKTKKKKKFMYISFGGLGCKGKFNSSPAAASAPEVIRSAAQWERKNTRRKMMTRTTLMSTSTTRNCSTNVVCCAPPGIGSASDVAPRPRTRSNNRQNSRIVRRTANGEEISRSNIRRQCPRSHDHRPHIMILRQNLQFARDLDGDDQYGPWRLDVDDMSYEQLVELSDRIGYVGTGLAEEKIIQYIRKFKVSTTESYSLLISNDTAWRCTICQDGYKVDDEIGKLECGHYHHIECIKKWLMQKNACPVCKIPAVHEN
ncbi:hypothetical protein HAX54_026096 [Datura stramonium]|uniref:RING-type E3 ubiquitin transferase n=1 Tax=Datura stramonium TaxID=4076 RepID=A0ABS8S754_DATST|nr:hypothetical protein [Datura stramonium]